MLSILLNYFSEKIIIIVIIIIFVKIYRDGSISKFLIVPFCLFMSIFIFAELKNYNLVENISIYNSLQHLNVDEIKEIRLLKENVRVKVIVDKNKIKGILSIIKQNKSYNANHPRYLEEFVLKIDLVKNKTIQFKITETVKNGVLIDILNNNVDENYSIAQFQNNLLLDYILVK